MRRQWIALWLALLSLPVTAAAETAKPPPEWVRLVPPDRMCIRFGDYDWLQYIRGTDLFSATVTLRARERALGETLWYLGRGTGRICSCGTKQAVLADLKAMLPELKKRPGIAYQDMKAADHVEGVIAGIEAEGIGVVPPAHTGCKR